MEKKYTVEKGISVIIPTFNRASFLYPTLGLLVKSKN